MCIDDIVRVLDFVRAIVLDTNCVGTIRAGYLSLSEIILPQHLSCL